MVPSARLKRTRLGQLAPEDVGKIVSGLIELVG